MAYQWIPDLTVGQVVHSGVFSHPDAGRLRVTFQGKWLFGNSDPVFSYDGDVRIDVRAFLGSGPDRLTAIMGYGANTAVLETPYAGGYATVPVGMEFVGFAHPGGAIVMQAKNLLISCHLLQEAG
jgi:hypothetical protein